MLGQIGGTTLKEEVQRLNARILHKEDPTRKIGEEPYVYGDRFLALDGISFSVKKGERVGIIGQNGAGKSTLLKLISRITAPTSGDIWLNGRVASMLEVGVGFHGELTGRENIYMNGAILGMKKKEIDEKIESIIEFSECRQFIDTPVKRYSSGMYVKLAFSVAAHLNSEIMIMDEVLAVGDLAFQKKCLDKMNDVSRMEGKTILYVSHNMNTIRQLCERCIVLDHGEIIFDGDVETGIGKYIGLNNDEYPVSYQYADMPRRWHFGKEVLIESFRFYDSNAAKFKAGGLIPFEVVLSSKIARDDIIFVLMVKDRNDAQRIAASHSEKFSICVGKHQVFRFVFNSQGLTPDHYLFDFEIIQFNTDGVHHSYDAPGANMPVELTGDIPENVWSTEYWGSIRMKDMEVFSE